MRRPNYYILIAALVLVSACDPVGPVEEEVQRQELLTLPLPTVPPWSGGTSEKEQELTFARLAPNVEAEVQEKSFWAVRGQTRTLQVRYLNQDPSAPPLLEFEVGAETLLTYPDGQPVLPGDSVEITVTLDPERRFIFHFQPHGLTFSPASPARLRLNYDGADADVNGDGIVNFIDAALELQFRVWRRDGLGLPWMPVPTVRLPGDLIEGRITHFTGFAMAS
jgi:hypothetical protein